MHIVMNSFTLQESAGWAALEAKIDHFNLHWEIKSLEFRGASLVRLSDTEGKLLMFFDDRNSLDEFMRDTAPAWFADNVQPHITGTVERKIGQIVAGHMK